MESGTSGFLSISDSDRRVTSELGEVSQASSCVQEWTSACLSSCSLGDRHLLSCKSNLRSFLDDARGCQCPFVLCLHPHYLLIGVWASRSYQERIGKSRSFGMWHHHRGYVSNFLVRQPHLRCVEKVGNPLQTKPLLGPTSGQTAGRSGCFESPEPPHSLLVLIPLLGAQTPDTSPQTDHQPPLTTPTPGPPGCRGEGPPPRWSPAPSSAPT